MIKTIEYHFITSDIHTTLLHLISSIQTTSIAKDFYFSTFEEYLNTNCEDIYFNTKERGAIAIFSCSIQEYIVHSFTQHNTIHTEASKKFYYIFKTNQGKRVFITQKKNHNNYNRIRKLQTKPNTCCRRPRHLSKQICTQGSSFYVYSKSTTTTHETLSENPDFLTN